MTIEHYANNLLNNIFRAVIVGSLSYRKVAKNAFEFVINDTTIRIEKFRRDYIIYVNSNITFKYKMENKYTVTLLFYYLLNYEEMENEFF